MPVIAARKMMVIIPVLFQTRIATIIQVQAAGMEYQETGSMPSACSVVFTNPNSVPTG